MTDIIDPIPTEQDIVAPEAEAEAEKQAEASWLDRSLVSLTTWNWEKAAWTALLIAALLIRVVALNNRTASHDESEHAWFAYNLFTGVDALYRGRKLGQAVKIHALRYARNVLKVGRVRTHHNTRNLPMIAIDRKLGYTMLPGTFLMQKALDP